MYYFTEADIHSSIQNDLLQGNSSLFFKGSRNISLVHLEYPTNFRYKKNKLLSGYVGFPDPEINLEDHETHITSKIGDRGNFDITVLNPAFIDEITKVYNEDHQYVPHIINKKRENILERLSNVDYSSIQKEILFGIEVKFIHEFNARNISMLHEVVRDNEKLRLAGVHSNGFIKAINLIFCSTYAHTRRDTDSPIIERIRDYISSGVIENYKLPDKVLNLYIESYFDVTGNKQTIKPIARCNKPDNWVYDLVKVLGIKLETNNI